MEILLFILISLSFCAVMSRNYLKNAKQRNALCNDGTTPAYYIRNNPKSNLWLVFLQGGGGCYSKESCDERYNNLNSRWLMTSNFCDEYYDDSGIFSDDCSENPAFCGANFVLIHYCSSDWWSGNNSKYTSGSYYHFYGKNIIRAVLEDIFGEYRNHNEKMRVFLSGTSAGGVGTLSNSDYVYDILSLYIKDLDYSVISDCGWFLDGPGMRKWECVNDLCDYETRVKLGAPMWNLIPHKECGEQYGDKSYLCLVGYHVYPFVKSRKMVTLYEFDSWQSYQDGITNKEEDMTETEKEWLLNRGKLSYESLILDGASKHGVWAQGCFSHSIVEIEKAFYYSPTNDGVTLNQAVKEFVDGGTPNHIDFCEGLECNEKCPNKI